MWRGLKGKEAGLNATRKNGKQMAARGYQCWDEGEEMPPCVHVLQTRSEEMKALGRCSAKSDGVLFPSMAFSGYRYRTLNHGMAARGRAELAMGASNL